jgi:hypothetical protein
MAANGLRMLGQSRLITQTGKARMFRALCQSGPAFTPPAAYE